MAERIRAGPTDVTAKELWIAEILRLSACMYLGGWNIPYCMHGVHDQIAIFQYLLTRSRILRERRHARARSLPAVPHCSGLNVTRKHARVPGNRSCVEVEERKNGTEGRKKGHVINYLDSGVERAYSTSSESPGFGASVAASTCAVFAISPDPVLSIGSTENNGPNPSVVSMACPQVCEA